MRRLVLLTLSLLLALLVALVAFHLGASRPHGAGSQAVGATEPSRRATSSASRTHRELMPSDPSSAAAACTAAAQEFVQAFLDKSSDRESRLDAITTPRLAELLARTAPDLIPKGNPAGALQIVNDTGTVITVSQRLSDGLSIAFDLAPDPTRAAGWVVTSVRPGDR